MPHLKLTLLGTVIALGAFAPVAYAEDDMAGFTPHYTVADAKFLPLIDTKQNSELKSYLTYEEREPCQNYKPVPTNFIRTGCDVGYNYPAPEPTPVTWNDPTPEPEPVAAAPRTVLMSYKLYFPFDSAKIETQSVDIINQIASEINTYKPGEVTVAGHTDRAGPADYNIGLSKRRADAVSNALEAKGVDNHVVAERALGETDPAIDTKDGVPLQDNRRVVVEFVK